MGIWLALLLLTWNGYYHWLILKNIAETLQFVANSFTQQVEVTER